MAKHIPQTDTGFYTLLNQTLERAFDTPTLNTTIENSFQRSAIAEQFLKFHDSDAPELNMFNNFSEYRRNIPEIGFEIMPNASGTEWNALFEVNKGGFLEGTSYIDCTDTTYLNCGTTDNCPEMGNYKGAAQSEIAEITFKNEYYNFYECISDLYNITDKFVYGDRMNEYLGLNVTKSKDMAQAVTEKVLSSIEKSILRRDLYETYSDNGLVAEVITTGPTALSGANAIEISRNDLIFQHHDYAIFRPGGVGAGNSCTPFCYRTSTLIGFVQATSPGLGKTKLARFGRAKDVINGALLPQVSVQAGDLIVALSGTLSVVTGGAFGGVNYNVFTPYPGINAGQITGNTLPLSCCNQNGLFGILQLAYGIEAGSTTKYMGLDLVNGAYKDLLTPMLYNNCCGLDPAQVTYLTVDNIFEMFEQVAQAIDYAKTMYWHPIITSTNEIVMEMAELTYRQVARSVYQYYPDVTAPKTTNLGNNGMVSALMRPEDRLKIDMPDIDGYKCTIKVIKKGMPEGMIRVGPKNPYFMATLKNLRGTYKDFNGGGFHKEIPLNIIGATGGVLGSGDAYRNQYVFEKWHGCGADEVVVSWKGQRKRAVYHIAPGTELIVQNVDFTKPLECGLNCKVKDCDPCVVAR